MKGSPNMHQSLATELKALAETIRAENPEGADFLNKVVEENTHFECDCVPNLGPAHCHACSAKEGNPVEWENRSCNLEEQLDMDMQVDPEEHRQMIHACVDALTPMVTNSTQAWNLWNHIAADRKHIRYALQTIWALYSTPEDAPALLKKKTELSDVHPPGGWHTFGTHIDYQGKIEFSETVGEDGLPLWERPIYVPKGLPDNTLNVLDDAIYKAVTEAVQDTDSPAHIAKAAIAAYRSALKEETTANTE